MANETTTTSMNDVYSTWVESQIVQEAREFAVTKKLLGFYDYSGKPGKTFQVPRWGSYSAGSITEGTELTTNTQATSDPFSVTVAMKGNALVLPDLLKEAQVIPGGLDPYIGIMARALAEQVESDCCAMASDLAVVENATGVALTLTNITSSQYTLAAAKAPGPIVADLHPVQVRDLRNDVMKSASAIWGAGSANAFMGGQPLRDMNGFVGELLGTPIFQSSFIPAATADRAGMIFSAGQGGMGAYVSKWDAKIDVRREPRYVGDLVVYSACYGLVEIVDVYGVKLLSLGS